MAMRRAQWLVAHDVIWCLTGGKLVYLLEGGYSSEGLAASCVATFLGLLGLPPPADVDMSVGPEPRQLVEEMLTGLERLHGL